MSATLWLHRLPLLRRHPAGLLLLVQLLGLLLYPVMEDTPLGRALFGAFGIVALSLVLWVVYRGSSANSYAVLLAVPAVVLSVLANALHLPDLLPFAQALEALLYFYAAGGLMFYMLEDHVITMDELIASAATFTLLAWGFAFAFAACQNWAPGSFGVAAGTGHPRSWLDLLFLSFALLSGVGLSDIVPALPAARALTMLEMFAGVMYIAIIVSRVIALAATRQHRQ